MLLHQKTVKPLLHFAVYPTEFHTHLSLVIFPLVLRLFPLAPLANLRPFLIGALLLKKKASKTTSMYTKWWQY